MDQARAAEWRGSSSDRPTVADWSGGYLGVEGSAGDAYGSFNFDAGSVERRSVPAFRSGDSTGRSDQGRNATTVLGGVVSGYNWQTGPYVYGLEADLYGANLKRPVSSTVPGFGFENGDASFSLIRAQADLFGAARARIGYAFERNLVYATFGLAGAETRFRSTFPDLDTGFAGIARRDHSYLGFTLGAGVQFAIAENLALGIDYRYADYGRSARFGLGSVAGPDGGAFSTQASFTSNQVMARLLWVPGGLRLPPEPDELAPHDPDNGDTGRFSLHGQTTFIDQGVTGFHSPYRGDNSLVPHQARGTLTATAFLGFKLTDNTELYYNPEFDQGFGLSRTLGVAGFPNGEAQKAGSSSPKLRSQRYFVRQTFGLGGETETVPDGPNQVAITRDIERITVAAGKFALGDFFDGNIYAHDPRVDFMNWSLWESAAYDFPANLPGYTQGIVVEYNRREFALRAAYTQVPKLPSTDPLDPRFPRRGGAVVEFEERHVLPILDQPGRLRIGAFSHEGRTANYRQVVALADSIDIPDVNTAVNLSRRTRNKRGAYINLEQALTPEIGLFARVSAADGRNENLSFTDVDRSASGGFSFKGSLWERPSDTIGIGAMINGLSRAHRDYFAAGGLGLVIGDGQLRYGPERGIETYYALGLTNTVTVSFDYQFIDNPGYNKDRGPANFFSSRLHIDF
ncbi:carbohydrate-selective porin OprB [Methylobacterium sp. ME121]|uniref:High affinity Mn2+ porin n=1 Tax=Methylobacterium persicinum TaxID=374426 RepID=A0ABU0HRF2_9HYPH|nr:high affinity Mn2+ porin [Methylobacterium persicinum]GAN50978.1 carbohydrate-selective porin OprB [Methylobacterium sp. ME121]